MVLITASTTTPVNPSGSTPTLTKEDLWTALVLKARDPKQFVSVIESSEIISENENGLTRKVSFKGDDASKDGVEERVVFAGGYEGISLPVSR
ncbi:hypothetical protein SI65_02754 [Aspergillus cristatus]|uniref:Uncharacterized protein n=1 Tax=Aspergillus cristatus TaxID=573508 RepID=A0A1E3BLS6_ASPCR|nr:hypothetical protein SI65_02754 [Aspergillus cristatus]